MAAADLFESVAISPLAMVVSDPRRPDNPLEAVNPAFCDLTRYSEAEIVGKNCRFLSGSETEPEATALIRDAVRNSRPVLVRILNYRADATRFQNGVMITPILDDEENVRWFLGSQVDLGDGPADSLASRRSAAAALVGALPRRQRQVLELMGRGLLNKQIAWQLKIAEKTVKMHRAHLLRRLCVTNSAEAIRLAVEAGL